MLVLYSNQYFILKGKVMFPKLNIVFQLIKIS